MLLSFAVLLTISVSGVEGGHASLKASISAAKKLYDLEMAKAFAALSKLTYCGPGPKPSAPFGRNDVMVKLVPASCGKFCERAGFKLGKTLLVETAAGGQKNAQFAYVSKVKPLKAAKGLPSCVVAFRGTIVRPANSNTNQNATLAAFTTRSCKSGCKAHGGALKLWFDVQPSIEERLEELGCARGSSIAFTGHSLGGQVASLAMLFLKDEGWEVALSYTYSQPKPLNKKAVEVFEKILTKNRPVSFFRITNTNDRVPRFPDSSQLWQPGFQVWYTSTDRASQYELCGTQLDAPACGNLGIPHDQLCRMMGGNPSWLQCGELAPFNGPHCRWALAPQLSICNFAGNANRSQTISSASQTCQHGVPLQSEAVSVTNSPPVFPPRHVPRPVKEEDEEGEKEEGEKEEGGHSKTMLGYEQHAGGLRTLGGLSPGRFAWLGLPVLLTGVAAAVYVVSRARCRARGPDLETVVESSLLLA